MLITKLPLLNKETARHKKKPAKASSPVGIGQATAAGIEARIDGRPNDDWLETLSTDSRSGWERI